jgi:transcriptional regulator with XRE-family HTH domain
MKSSIFGERIKTLRLSLGKSQKEFAEYIGIPQPSMSAYENGKNNPTIEVLINIADKCNISIDWLCGRQSEIALSDTSEVADFLYNLVETKEIGCKIEVHDHIENGSDIEEEGETDDRYRWWTSLTFYGNDKRYECNSVMCQLIRKVHDNISDLESYSISNENYELEKKRTKEYYTLPLTKREFPELPREERIKKHIEYLKEHGEF